MKTLEQSCHIWSVSVLTLFPEIYPGPLGHSLVGNALEKNLWSLDAFNIRDYANDRHGTVDDIPYGGGHGMVMRPDVLSRAIDDLFIPNNNRIVYLTPRGRLLDQKLSRELSELDGVNLLCGRFEGVDERIFSKYEIMNISLGDFVLSSGDMAAFPLIDSVVRLLPDVLGNKESLYEESFGLSEEYENLLEYPHYTRPSIWEGLEVPEVLRSGNHALIDKWRLEQAKKITKESRPDLMKHNKLR